MPYHNKDYGNKQKDVKIDPIDKIPEVEKDDGGLGNFQSTKDMEPPVIIESEEVIQPTKDLEPPVIIESEKVTQSTENLEPPVIIESEEITLPTNPIVQTNLIATGESNIFYQDGLLSNSQQFVGTYHIHEDGTMETGTGLSNDGLTTLVHNITPSQILVPTGNNPIIISLQTATIEDNLFLSSTLEQYTGPYHVHQDGTKETGTGTIDIPIDPESIPQNPPAGWTMMNPLIGTLSPLGQYEWSGAGWINIASSPTEAILDDHEINPNNVLIPAPTGNYITEVNLEAPIVYPAQFVYQSTGEIYYGLYHKHLDGTLMIGAGILGVTHGNNPPEVIVPIEEYQYNNGEGPNLTVPPIDENYIREVFADKIYDVFFNELNLPTGVTLDYNSLQSTIRDGKITTGRNDDEQLVFFKKDRNTPENRKDFTDTKLSEMINSISSSVAASSNPSEFNLVEFIQNKVDEGDIKILTDESTPPSVVTNLGSYNLTAIPGVPFSLNKIIYVLQFTNDNVPYNINFAEINYIPNPIDETAPWLFHRFENVINISQITLPKIGNRLNITQAKEILDTNIFELLPQQRTRQDQVDDFFNQFNTLIGSPPSFSDADNDGVNEQIDNNLADQEARISIANNPNAYITRLERHTDAPNGQVNVGKTLQTMRNRLNQYLGDVDNVVQIIPDQRPEYENIQSGFLKIREPNQAIILRNPNQELEFQKDDSYLNDGFTITMWVRFVGKTGRGTLFNFGNPTSTESPYGFKLETITRNETIAGITNYKRMVRLVVRGEEGVYDSHFGTQTVNRYDTVTGNQILYEGFSDSLHAFNAHTQIPTDDLNEWFFICATYNPLIQPGESVSHEIALENNNFNFRTDKQFWLNHRNTNGTLTTDSGFGARCKVEVISRSDLLRARGYKVDSLELNVQDEAPTQEDSQDQQESFE